jgi:hypothetical protein
MMQSGTRYYWLAVVLAAAIVLSLSLRTHSAVAGTQQSGSQTIQSPAASTDTYEGIVTDTRCGAKHSANVGLSAADCTRACVHAGEHFALVDGDRTYVLNGEPDALKRMSGERVKIAGNLNDNTIEVLSVAEVNPKAE